MAVGVGDQRLLGLGAQSAPRRVEDAAQGDRVIGVGDGLEVGQRVLDLAALVEARAADDAVGDAGTHQHLLQRAGLRVGAVEDRDVAPVERLLVLVLVGGPGGARSRGQPVDLADDEAGLVVVGVGGVHRDERPRSGGGPQVLRAAPLVAGDDSVGGGEDVLRRAVVLLQQDGGGAGEVALELLDVADRGTTEGVDRLVGVADDGELAGRHLVRPGADQRAHQHVLGVVRVLVLVDQDMTEAAVVVLGDGRVIGEQPDRAHDEVVEVQGVGLREAPLVLGVRGGDDARDRVVGGGVRELRGAHQLVLLVRDPRRHHFRREALDVDVLRLEDHLDEALGVLRVVDGERGGQPRRGMLGAQDPHARGVEGRHPHPPRVRPDQPADALAHLGGGLVREGDRQDLPGPRPARGQEIRDAVRERARLAGPGARHDEQGPAGVRDGRALLGVESVEQGLGIARRAVGVPVFPPRCRRRHRHRHRRGRLRGPLEVRLRPGIAQSVRVIGLAVPRRDGDVLVPDGQVAAVGRGRQGLQEAEVGQGGADGRGRGGCGRREEGGGAWSHGPSTLGQAAAVSAAVRSW